MMNEVIEKIVDNTAFAVPGVYQLEYESGTTGVEFTDTALKKFVNLIILESISAMSEADSFYGEWMGNVLKKHFEVE